MVNFVTGILKMKHNQLDRRIEKVNLQRLLCCLLLFGAHFQITAGTVLAGVTIKVRLRCLILL